MFCSILLKIFNNDRGLLNTKIKIDQLIQQAFTAHNQGKFKEAKNFYREILKNNLKHPDVNHNLGLLEFSSNSPTVALPLLKNAIKYNPNKEQFWISYINALVKVNQLDKAELYSRTAIAL